ncbi:hypothetical protein [Herbidospora mongoliensis]|uniref:hypothetical protein n=1 Tax=Herbidospora mongoliensis TaxID=688067 RepID=UPI00082B6176|nr:hypothetical protein [Herbidospora mongoliensis]
MPLGRLLAALSLAALTACATAPPPPTAASTDLYVTGADPDDDPCERVVSALGFAELILKPAGQEESQEFGEGVRGRIAYGEGVILTYGPKLPKELAGHAATLKRTIRELVPAATPHEKAVASLKEWRAAATAIERGCEASSE